MGMWAGPKAPEHTAAPKQSWITPPAAGPAADATHFLDALEAGRPSDVPAATAAAATEILLAAYRSASQGGELTPLSS
jgi:predicted dehydrogenase